MLLLCRLCATCTQPSDLTINLSDLESKLMICCGWKESENESEMPKKVCNLCVDQLQRSWNFVECIWAAEKQLNKLISDKVQINSESSFSQICDVKSEEERESTVIVSEIEEVKPSFSDDVDDDNDNKDFDYDDDDDDGIFGEPINYSNDDSSNNEQKEPTEIKTERAKTTSRRKRRRIDDKFLAAIEQEDRLEGGLISANGIAKLEKLFPDMKNMSWDQCGYKCDECNRLFKGCCQIYSHVRSIHITEVLSIELPCVYCNAKFRREFALNRHIASEHFLHLKYRCPHCTDYYWNIRELIKHRSMHSDVKYVCETCGSSFANKDHFYAHCSSHSDKKKTYTDPNEQFICEMCNKHFKSKGSIRNHMILHTDRFDHVCEQCGWKFQSKGNLKGHLASTHRTEKNFKCEQCQRSFKTMHHLKNHSIMHDDSYKPHVCTICNMRFKRKNTLNVHVRSHTKDTPYSCKFCFKSFRHCITKQTHERAHLNFKPYACTECSYACTSKGNLNKHMMRAHSIDFRNHVVKINK